MAIVVSFINFKGGVGKTTLCVETAAALAAQYDKKVLLIDLDPQTNATLWLMKQEAWEEHAREKGTLKDFFEACLRGKDDKFDLASIMADYPVKSHGRLDLIPSHIELAGIDLKLARSKYFSVDGPKGRKLLRNALTKLRRRYDYILMDCPPNLYLATQSGLFASDYFVIVALAEYLSTLGIAHILQQIKAQFGIVSKVTRGGAKSARLPTPGFAGLIFNRIWRKDQGNVAEERIMGKMRAEYGDRVFRTTVPMSTRLAVKPEQGAPIAVSQDREDADYADRIGDLAKEFMLRTNGAPGD